MSSTVNRRTFIKSSTATTLTAGAVLASSAAVGSNERIRAGFIGIGNRGGQLIEAARPNEDLEVAGLCDVYEPYVAKWSAEFPAAKTFGDFRDLLSRNDVDVVFVATPDHWHGLQTVMACDAGKDVYVEKPLSITIHEGQRMVAAARRNDRVVQVGTQRRSSPLYRDLAAYLSDEPAGKLLIGSAYRLSNMWPDGIGKAADSKPPEGLNWDLWLGPRAYRPFNENIAPYKFRWWSDYSSQLGNWGVHYFDLIRWMMNEEAPESVSVHGGVYAVDDDRDIPDTLQATYEFASGRLLLFGQYEAAGNRVLKSGEVELRGTRGTIYASESGYEVVPERGGQFQDLKPRMEAVKESVKREDSTAHHIRNFLDCVKTRKRPNADVEEGHKSTVFCHLGNIALKTRSRVAWDAKAERIVSPESANAHLHYEYRDPWKLG